MKKYLYLSLLVIPVAVSAQSREAVRKHTEGTTNYYGTAVTSLRTEPSTNAYVWKVFRTVSDTNGIVEGKWAFGVVDGKIVYEAVKWSEITSTNVVYR